MKVSTSRFELDSNGALTNQFRTRRGEMVRTVAMATRVTTPQWPRLQAKTASAAHTAGMSKRKDSFAKKPNPNSTPADQPNSRARPDGHAVWVKSESTHNT